MNSQTSLGKVPSTGEKQRDRFGSCLEIGRVGLGWEGRREGGPCLGGETEHGISSEVVS